MSTLQIVVTGICAFTPGVPSASNEVSSKLRIIMPASRRRMTTSTATGEQPVVIPVHVSFFATTAKYVINPPDRVHDLRVSVDSMQPDEDRLVWLLGREYITLSADAGDKVKFATGTPANTEGPPANSELPFVHWIADMRDIWADREAIRADCLKTSNPAADVAVHLELNGGNISSYFATGEKKHVVEVLPVKTTAVKQVLARKLMIEMPIVNNVVLVKMKSLDSGKDLSEIRLDGTDIDVMFGNVTLQDVVDLQLDISTGEIHKGRDNHFELYYDILKVDGGGSTELPAPVRAKQGAHHNCPPLMTS